MYFTYINLPDYSARHYVGSTRNVEETIRSHNADLSKSPKGKGPWKLVLAFPLDPRAKAMKLDTKTKKRGIFCHLQNL